MIGIVSARYSISIPGVSSVPMIGPQDLEISDLWLKQNTICTSRTCITLHICGGVSHEVWLAHGNMFRMHAVIHLHKSFKQGVR